MEISKRIASMIASPIRKFLPLAQAAQKRGTKVFALNIGQPDLEPPKAFWKGIAKFKSGVLAYAPSTGLVETQAAWSTYFKQRGMPLEPKDILVTTGGSEAIFFSMGVVTDPGDEIIVFEPAYSSYKSYASILNISLVPVTLTPTDGYHLPGQIEIEKKVTARTRAIVVINPNNPTGAVYTKEELVRIAAVAKKHNLWLIADETYRDLVFKGKRSVSLYEIDGIQDRIILTDSVSKRLNLCGARVGCLASTNPEIIANALKLAQARLSTPTMEQVAIVPLLAGPQSYLEGVRREYLKRRDVVYQALKAIPKVKVHEPEGAFYLMATLPVDNAEDFIRFMLNDFSWKGKTVFVTPGEDFYLTPGRGRSEVRIAYVLNTRDLKDAMVVFAKGLETFIQKEKEIRLEGTVIDE